MKSLQLPSLTALLTLWEVVCGEEIVQSIEGTVGAENYTHYKLDYRGHLRIEVISLIGDADMYVSDETTSPNCENFKQESVSCGFDVIDIPASYNRPVAIAIYGHFIHEVSHYRLTLIKIADDDEDNYEQLMQKLSNYEDALRLHHDNEYLGGDRVSGGQRPVREVNDGSRSTVFEDEEDEGFGIWQIIVTVLKIFFEIIL